MKDQEYDGPRPETAHVVTVTIGAAGQRKRRQTVFVTATLPDEYAAKTNAKQLGLEIEILASVVQVSEDDPNAVIEALLDSAASDIHGLISGAKVDPAKARMNELERSNRANTRAIADMHGRLGKLTGLFEKLAAGPTMNAPLIAPVIAGQDPSMRVMADDPEDLGAPDLATGPDAEPRTIGQARTPDGRAIEVAAVRDTRRKRGELRSEAATPDMNLVGAIPKSDMFTVGEDGEIEMVKLPTVGDSLKSMAWLSDIPKK